MEIPNGDAIKNAIASMPEFGGKPSFLDAMNDVELVDWLNKEPAWYRSKVIDLARENAAAVQVALDNIQAAMPGARPPPEVRAPTPVADIVSRAWSQIESNAPPVAARAPEPEPEPVLADDDGVEIEFEDEEDEAEYRAVAQDLDRTPVEFEPEEGEIGFESPPDTVEFEPEDDREVALVEFKIKEIQDDLYERYWPLVGYTFRVLKPVAAGIKCQPGMLFEVEGLTPSNNSPDILWLRALSLEEEHSEILVSPHWFDNGKGWIEWVDWETVEAEEEEEEEAPSDLVDPASQLYADDLEQVVHQLKIREAQVISAGGKEAQLKYLARCFGNELDDQLRDILRVKNEAA